MRSSTLRTSLAAGLRGGAFGFAVAAIDHLS
jgi:hypothetical protein